MTSKTSKNVESVFPEKMNFEQREFVETILAEHEALLQIVIKTSYELKVLRLLEYHVRCVIDNHMEIDYAYMYELLDKLDSYDNRPF